MGNEQRETELANLASCVAGADRVEHLGVGADPPGCLICGRPGPYAVAIVFKTAAVGKSEFVEKHRFTGVCTNCHNLTSPKAQAAVAELARAAAHVDSLLGLIRHRAANLLSPWWGGVGACSAKDVDDALVALRRARERVGIR